MKRLLLISVAIPIVTHAFTHGVKECSRKYEARKETIKGTLSGRSAGQYNCQDYADDLRSAYYKLLLDIKIRCKCNLK